MNEIEYFFAEDQGRYIIEIKQKDLKEVVKILDKNSVHHEKLGVIIEKEMIINEKTKVTIEVDFVLSGGLKILAMFAKNKIESSMKIVLDEFANYAKKHSQ